MRNAAGRVFGMARPALAALNACRVVIRNSGNQEPRSCPMKWALWGEEPQCSKNRTGDGAYEMRLVLSAPYIIRRQCVGEDEERVTYGNENKQGKRP